jgi:hypothetical protein
MEEGNGGAGWQEGLPDALKQAPFIGKAVSLDDAVAKLAHAAKLVGTSVRIPTSESTDEDREKFYARLVDVPGVARLPLSDDTDGFTALMDKLGRPDKAENYALPELEGHEWDADTAKHLREYAHEAGLTAAQFKRLASRLGEQEAQATLAVTEARDEAARALRQDWGDTLEDRVGLIEGWLQHSGAPEDLMATVRDRALGLDAMNWLYDTAKHFKGEVSPVSSDGAGRETSITPAQAREMIPTVIKDMLGMPEYDNRRSGLQRKLITLQRLATANGGG